MTDRTTPADRFWTRINKEPNGCWLWAGYIGPNGYATVYVGGGRGAKKPYVHRYAYEQLVGPIPDGLDLDHVCKVRHCVNPSHLEPVTHRENVLRGDTFARRNVLKTHCDKGHPLDSQRNGRRACSACYPQRGVANRNKTHCKQGHAFDEENTYLFPDGSGRGCRKCRIASAQRSRVARTQGVQ